MINLKAVGDKIRAVILSKIDFVIDKIAIHSKAYKLLQNEVNNIKDSDKALVEFNYLMKHSKMLRLVPDLYRRFSIQMLLRFDEIAVHQTTVNDIIIAENETEKVAIQKEMNQFSGIGRVHTIDEFLTLPLEKLKPDGIYITSSVYVKEYTQLVNLLYKYNLDERKVL